MAETMAPDFVTPPKGVHRFPVTSIVPTGRPLDEGIKLFLNKDLEGFVLEPDSEGLWLSPVENTVVPRATGGAIRSVTTRSGPFQNGLRNFAVTPTR